jgi:hypothetical protein
MGNHATVPLLSQQVYQFLATVPVSRPLGRGTVGPLRIYAHLFRNDDSKAAAAINAILK